MPLIQDSHDSLPYIDTHITPEKRSQISTLLEAELPEDHATTLHPLLPDLPSPAFSPLVNAELERIASKEPLSAIDTTRYETLESPAATDPTSDETRPQLLEAWKDTLQKAYASSTHLGIRLQNLALLEQFGKNAWLVGNSQLEEILKAIEKELVDTRQATENADRGRQQMQVNVNGELAGLDEGWRKTVGRMVEVEVAAEGLRREILRRRREGAI